MTCSLPILLAALLAAAAAENPSSKTPLTVQARDQAGQPRRETILLEPSKTAVVVVDMWDRHWCTTYTARVGNLVPRMNKTLDAARKLGVQVVFVPSDVVGFYADAPQRKAMLAIRRHPEPAKIPFDPPRPPGPVDQCECGPDRPCKPGGPWTRQHPGLAIAPGDLIGDGNNGRELLNLCADRGIDTLLYMGVATNICVQSRGAGIRNMKQHGLRAVLVGDLAEAITANGIGADGKPNRDFTPAAGTAMVQRHIEQHLCPTLQSRQLIAAAGLDPHAGDRRPHVVFVSAESEYDTHLTFPRFAKKYLDKDFRSTFLNATGPELKGRDDVPGLEAVHDAELVVLGMRRRALPVPQMDHLERYIRSGKPLVVLRVSAAAFQFQGAAPRGCVVWDRFDKEVLGCNYLGYNPKSRETGSDVWIAPEARDHPILRGVPQQFHSPSWIYRHRPLAETVAPLMVGRWSKEDPDEPVAWTNTYQGGRVFYTTLGHPGDFELEGFNRLLDNAVRWVIQKPEKP